jgi:hypothetical protein
MLTSDNKLRYKAQDREFYKSVTSQMISVMPKLAKLYLYNKRCEFLRNYDSGFMQYYNFLKSFRSMKEVFAFLGVTAKVDFTPSNLEKCMAGHNFKNKTILIEADLTVLNDTIRMAGELGMDITQTDKSIKNLHDELIHLINLKQADSYSDEQIVPPYFYKLKDILDEHNAVYYTSKRQLFLAGQAFHNCISGRSYKLATNMFFSMEINGVNMIFDIESDRIVEGKGMYNKYHPQEVIAVAEILGFVKETVLPF